MYTPHSLEGSSPKCKSPTKDGSCNKSVLPHTHAHTGFCEDCYYPGIVRDYAYFHDYLLKGKSRFFAAVMTGFIEIES